MQTQENLGEAYHRLQAKADVSYWTAKALRALGREEAAITQFEVSAHEASDFQAMAVTEHSELSYYRGLSLIELGKHDEAQGLFEDFKDFAERELKSEAQIDYFATSLPLLLVFEDDLNQAKHRNAQRLLSLAQQGLTRLKRSLS
ncbi:MAG: tetratricopeptide (TPR) repeat protein [Candidatus Azotimanducaceae bacterium]|jgi:tetratricopeptide (TPR) repeat protein